MQHPGSENRIGSTPVPVSDSMHFLYVGAGRGDTSIPMASFNSVSPVDRLDHIKFLQYDDETLFAECTNPILSPKRDFKSRPNACEHLVRLFCWSK